MSINLILKRSFPEILDVHTFVFEPNENFEYQAGQFLRYTLKHPNPDSRGIKRYFTIASAPSEGFIQISTRISNESSTFKQALICMQPGDSIQTEGPMGSFVFDNSIGQSVWIAGGIGITPFRAMLKQLDFENLNPNITLLYANKTSDIAFKDLIDEFGEKHSNFKVFYIQGRVDEGLINTYIQDVKSPTYYISGPEPMVISYMEMLGKLGVEPNHLKRDAFPGYEDELEVSRKVS